MAADVQDVLDALERVAPSRFAFTWDKIGLQVGNREVPVEKAVVALDRSMSAIRFAIEQNAQLLLTHHPLIFDPLPTVTADTYEGRAIQNLIFYGIAHVAAHTNWDAADGGINDTLASLLQLQNVRKFGSSAGSDSYKLLVFVPQDSLERVIDACSAAGAGVIGEYRRCAFYTKGQGTYEASVHADPAIGKAGERTTTDEVRLEMICPARAAKAVISALDAAHPYEEPAYDLLAMAKGLAQPMGRIGESANEVSLEAFARTIDASLSTRAMVWGDPNKTIRQVAVVGGAADSEWRVAQSAGADILVTGEVKQHIALEAAESGFAIVAAGHYATEHPGCRALRDRMDTEVPDVVWTVFEPASGQAGRPL
jgi:dinuclear metal center YbgI/SA1388 family protein